jgi:predicted HTH domain antitoxin
MRRIEIELPDNTSAWLDCETAELSTKLRAAAAAKLYELGRVSQQVGAQIAGVSRTEFLMVLSQHKVSPFQETAEDVITGAQLLIQP